MNYLKIYAYQKHIFRHDDHGLVRKIYPGRDEGFQLILDAHTDKVSSGTISDNFRGVHVVIDGKEKYPFTSRNGILIKSGQDNEVVIKATRFEADRNIKDVKPSKRNCYFTEEHPLKLQKVYTQANCFYQCKIEYVRDVMYDEGKVNRRCIPWFYPVEDQYVYELCDPWQTSEFQTLLKNVSDNRCEHCLPDCRSTKFEATISSAPFKGCDRTNLGTSSLCDLSTNGSMMMNPPMWKQTVLDEYEKFNGLHIPHFVKNQRGVFSNIRKYVPFNPEVNDLVLRGKREEELTYNALEEDITMVNFYFDESNIIQYTTFERMTVIDFMSSVN